MSKNGLHASVWAPKQGGDVHYNNRLDDWTCPSCGFSNFQWRTECFRCSFSKGSNKQDTVSDLPEMTSVPKSYQNIKQDHGQRTDFTIHNILGAKGNAEDDFVRYNSDKGGLSTSRWAPRNYDRNIKETGEVQVWTRVCWEMPDSSHLLI